MKLTPVQERVLNFLQRSPGAVTCRQVALELWPDNRLWHPHVRVGRNISLPGSSVLIMKAGAILRRMQVKRVVTKSDDYRWIPTTQYKRKA